MTLTLPELEKIIDQFRNDQLTDRDLNAFLRVLEISKERASIDLINKTTDINILLQYTLIINSVKTRITAEQRLKELYPEKYLKMEKEKGLELRRHRR